MIFKPMKAANVQKNCPYNLPNFHTGVATSQHKCPVYEFVVTKMPTMAFIVKRFDGQVWLDICKSMVGRLDDSGAGDTPCAEI